MKAETPLYTDVVSFARNKQEAFCYLLSTEPRHTEPEFCCRRKPLHAENDLEYHTGIQRRLDDRRSGKRPCAALLAAVGYGGRSHPGRVQPPPRRPSGRNTALYLSHPELPSERRLSVLPDRKQHVSLPSAGVCYRKQFSGGIGKYRHRNAAPAGSRVPETAFPESSVRSSGRQDTVYELVRL